MIFPILLFCVILFYHVVFKKKQIMLKVKSSWSHSDKNDLILAIQEHPCVWEYSSIEYKDRHKLDQAWCKIEKKCPGHTTEECKAEWANLKTAFQDIQKKIKTKSDQGIEISQINWPHWEVMQFYSRHDDGKSTEPLSNLDSSPSCSVLENVPSKNNDKKQENINLMVRAVKYLETEEDNWHTIGMYLASQMRELSKGNKKAADRLHFQLMKTTMKALESEEDSNF